MKIYVIGDIHGCLAELDAALMLVLDHLEEEPEDTKLIFLGDYIHGGEESRGVLNRVMGLQDKYGDDRVIALMGNHEMWVLDGTSTIDQDEKTYRDVYMEACGNYDDYKDDDDKYINWISSLPVYHVEGNTIFCHAGIDEEAGELWEWGTDEYIFTGKYPAEIGHILGLDMKVVAGHIGTATISENPNFHDIYYDGASHYYCDGTVFESGIIPVMMVDTEKDKYYRVTESGHWLIEPYDIDY